MMIIDVQEAIERLSDLVEMAANGQPFMISENGTPMVKVSSYRPDEEGKTTSE